MAIRYSFAKESSTKKSCAKENSEPAWAKQIVPSVGDLIFLGFLGVLSFSALSLRLLGDAGIGWHIRTGQIIWATHAVPHVDPFSSTMAGQQWFAWEWLYDALAGGLHDIAGLNGVVLLTALIISATFSVAFCLLLRRGTNFAIALILVLLAASASTIHFLARPHVVSWLFTVIWFSVLESGESDRGTSQEHKTWQLWLVPLLMVLWVNLHGGFLVGVGLIGIYWIGAVGQSFRLREDRLEEVLEKVQVRKRARELTLIGVASALATFVNPYGWRLHVHVYRYLTDRFLMDHIDEFRSPNFHDIPQKCFAILLVLTFLAFAIKGNTQRRFRLTHILLVLFALCSGLYASRNLPVSSLLLVLLIGPAISTTVFERINRANSRRLKSSIEIEEDESSATFLQRMQRVELSRRGHLWPFAAIVFVAWIAFHHGMLGSKQLMDAHFSHQRFPVAAVDYVEKRNLPGPLLAPDDWGGYLIYRLYPGKKVVVDDRHDLYGEQFLKGYLSFIHLEPDWDRFIQQHPTACIVVPKDSAVATVLGITHAWKLAYGDDTANVYIPANLSIP
jgi:hypothetical protein